MRLDRDSARTLVASARVARLATVRADGRVDLVPVTFALGDDRFFSAVDHKPKSTVELQRLANITDHPAVTVLVDHYDDADWASLWWVRLRGRATVHRAGPERDEAVAALVARYPQYRDRPPLGPAIVVAVTAWSGWAGWA